MFYMNTFTRYLQYLIYHPFASYKWSGYNTFKQYAAYQSVTFSRRDLFQEFTSSALLKSCQLMKLWKGFPVLLKNSIGTSSLPTTECIQPHLKSQHDAWLPIPPFNSRSTPNTSSCWVWETGNRHTDSLGTRLLIRILKNQRIIKP